MSNRILFVDDDPNILSACQRNLRKDFALETALGGEQALALMQSQGPYAVIVSDMQMPGMNGIQFLNKAEEHAPDTIRLMLTGNADQKTAADAVNQGHIFRFLNKPCPPDELTIAIKAALEQYRLINAERELLEKTLNGAVKILTDVLSTVDPQSFGRGRKLREYMRTFLQCFRVNQSWELDLAAMLSPIGRVTIPPAVLMKERSGLTLTSEEKEMFRRVPEVGAQLLEQIPRLENVARIVRFQTKCFDGSGFPPGASGGEDIPIGARILKVLEDLAELESKGASKGAALIKMQQAVGAYDPTVVSAACRAFDVGLPATGVSVLPPIGVRVQDLNPNQMLAEDVKTLDGILVMPNGSVLSSMFIERLQNFRALGAIADKVLVHQ